MNWIWLVPLLAVAVIVWASWGGKGARPSPARSGNASGRDGGRALPAWLEERFARARAAHKGGADGDSEFPRWYFESATERQLLRLQEMAVTVKGTIWKGTASDLIGLSEPPDSADAAEVARFFGWTKPTCQTQERMQWAMVASDPEKLARWEGRPATVLQKERLALLGAPAAKSLTAAEAEQLLAELMDEAVAGERAAEQADELIGLFDSVLDDLSDRDAREIEGFKRKPTPAQLRRAIEAVQNDKGAALTSHDQRVVCERLLADNPQLRADE